MFYHAAKRSEMVELLRMKKRLKRLNPDDVLTPAVQKRQAYANS